MHTIEVTDEQLRMLHESMDAWINSFGHDQADILRASKELRAIIDREIAAPSHVTIPGKLPRGFDE